MWALCFIINETFLEVLHKMILLEQEYEQRM